jgi:hypothetical protein
MSDKSGVTIEYSEPQMPEFQVRSLDDLQSALKWLGVIGPRIYIGSVTSAGAAGAIFPPGWSVVRNATGSYTITHNLNTMNYAMFPVATLSTPLADGVIPNVNTKNAADCTILWGAPSSSAANTAFDFALVVNS